ncbi:MAG: T9SS type A sorting domain-containing protein [Saprospiraceae bacterium]
MAFVVNKNKSVPTTNQQLMRMKKIKQLVLVSLLTSCVGTTFSQIVDSLSVSPNPFNVATTIHFEIFQSDTITLRVFNLVGQTIKTFFDSTILPSGSYNINLRGDSLLDGMYFMRLDIGSTKKITKRAIKSGSTSGIGVSKEVDKFLVFPNPTNDLITIPLDGNKTIIVADLNGKILKSISTDQKVISLLDIATGQYFITILTNKKEKLTTQIILKHE